MYLIRPFISATAMTSDVWLAIRWKSSSVRCSVSVDSDIVSRAGLARRVPILNRCKTTETQRRGGLSCDLCVFVSLWFSACVSECSYSVSNTCTGLDASERFLDAFSAGRRTRFHHITVPVIKRIKGKTPSTVHNALIGQPPNRPKCNLDS